MSAWVKPIHLNRQAFTWVHWSKRVWSNVQNFWATDASPHKLALSFALGTLISLAPTPGLNTILTLGLMGLFRQLPRVGVMAAMAVWNVFVVTPMYAIGYKLGLFLFGDTVAAQPTTTFLDQLSGLSRGFFLGNIITAVVVAFVCYGVVYVLFAFRRK